MDKLFYYLRDKENRPVVTICLIEERDRIARGVAICSQLDQPCKKTGRGIAGQRAQAALYSKETRLEIATKRAKEILKGCKAPRVVKTKSFTCEDVALLSRMERKILEKARQAREARP